MIEGFQKKEILEKLNISDKEYINNISVIRAYENKKILLGQLYLEGNKHGKKGKRRTYSIN